MNILISLALAIVVVAFIAYPLLAPQLRKRRARSIDEEIERMVLELRQGTDLSCPECGASYRRGETACPQCQTSLARGEAP